MPSISTSGEKTSAVLRMLVENSDSPRISVRDIVEALGQRVYALLLVVLGLPNCLPMPPPIPLVCGLLIVFVAIQMLMGLSSPWLPQRVLNLSASRPAAARVMGRAAPWLAFLERFARPRLAFLQNGFGVRIVGGLVLVFAVALLFSAPFVGQLPLGVAFCLVGIGLVERDGLIIGVGAMFGSVGVLFSIGFVLAIMAGLMKLLHLA
jgi:hypothetical protein